MLLASCSLKIYLNLSLIHSEKYYTSFFTSQLFLGFMAIRYIPKKLAGSDWTCCQGDACIFCALKVTFNSSEKVLLFLKNFI